jgi:SAM-dependent methyltransferase
VPTIEPHARVASHLAALGASRARGGVTRRKAQGAHYTPPQLVEHVLDEAMRRWRPRRSDWRVLDPACGAGAFLVAAARRAAAVTGEPMARVLGTRIHGTDIDPVAVQLAREALLGLLHARTSASTRREVAAALARHLVVADALDRPQDELFDLIVGNPPFLNQLARGTAASRARAKWIAERTGGAVRGYADLATAFLIDGLARLAPQGRLAFVMPQSFLSTGDARAARDAALGLASLRSIWSCNERLFEDALVRVSSVCFERAAQRAVRRAFGADFRPLRGDIAPPVPGDASWAPLLAAGFGAPQVEIDAGRATIGSIATATADFRDQYYGLRGALEEDGRGPRLATTRHIDLAACSWGECEVRVMGERFRKPTVVPARLVGVKGMSGWLEARLVPKVLVATQTRVIEAFVDGRGEYAPLVPLITVVPRGKGDLWLLAAAIASPVVAARALALFAGSALGAGAIKLSAGQLLSMPLPVDRRAWRVSAEFLRARRFDEFARASCAAHRVSQRESREILAFWEARLVPRGRTAGRTAADAREVS